MDAYEATMVVFSRIQALDRDHTAKILGFLLIQDHDEKEMIRLAFGPDALLHTIMAKARKDLGLLPAPGSGPLARAHPPPPRTRRSSSRARTLAAAAVVAPAPRRRHSRCCRPRRGHRRPCSLGATASSAMAQRRRRRWPPSGRTS